MGTVPSSNRGQCAANAETCLSATAAPSPKVHQRDDRLLTEVQRQEKYLAELPADFSFPLFNSARAVESQRQSGYRTTASAAREIVDNAIEAGAKRVHVIFDYPEERKTRQRRDAVSAVAFIDDGSGMVAKMARYALSWGGGTHFDDPDFIGRFGFGLPNASINQTRRVVHADGWREGIHEGLARHHRREGSLGHAHPGTSQGGFADVRPRLSAADRLIPVQSGDSRP